MSAGFAYVATASFLASRAVPSGGFALALAGGVALARAAQRHGLKQGWAAGFAAMLQTVAIMGPSRITIPLTQAVSAPVMGRMEVRGYGTTAQALVAAVIRTLENVPATAFYVAVIVGVDAWTGTYDRLLGWLPFLPDGQAGAVAATLLALAAWTVGASIVQAVVYRRGLRLWPADDDPEDHPPLLPPRPRPASARFDPRAIVVAGIVAFGLLVASTAWPLLLAITGWLAIAWLLARGDPDVVRPGLVLTAVIAWGAFSFGLIGGMDFDLTLRRTLRAALLVLVATWVRSAAGEDGLREVFRRALHRFRRVPGVPETSQILDGLGSATALTATGKRLIERCEGVPTRPVPLTDAVIGWVAAEAGRHAAGEPVAPATLRARRRDGLLVAIVAATALTLPLAT